jgi:hypothetical protein
MVNAMPLFILRRIGLRFIVIGLDKNCYSGRLKAMPQPQVLFAESF